jgi:hypothetical protein
MTLKRGTLADFRCGDKQKHSSVLGINSDGIEAGQGLVCRALDNLPAFMTELACCRLKIELRDPFSPHGSHLGMEF